MSKKTVFFRNTLFVSLLLAVSLSPLSAQQQTQQFSFGLKSAPADLDVLLNGQVQKPLSTVAGIRTYRIADTGAVRFSADGYVSQEFYAASALPIKNGLAEIKLEKENGRLKLLAQYSTGRQPKSAMFSPDGKRLFVPLLAQHGVEVFRVEPTALVFEKRLTVPGSKAGGFVESCIDTKRREYWVSNMEENKVHIYDLDTLEYKQSVAVGGVFPKVVEQTPAGDLTLVSNWLSENISVFNSDTKELLRKIPVGGIPRGMAFSPDGAFCYVALYDTRIVAVVDLKQNKVTNRYHLGEGYGAIRHVLYRDGKLYVSDMHWGTVNILDAPTGKLLVSKRVGSNINTIALSPDGKWVFASSRGRNGADYLLPGPEFGAVYMLDATDLTLIERVWGRNQPTGLAVSPDGKLMVFTDFLDANLELYAVK